MRSRSLSTVILLLALLASAWGNVLAAARCHHLAAEESCCRMQSTHNAASHEMMGEMQMTPDASAQEVSAQEMKGGAFTRPEIACEHCLAHSQAAALGFTLRQAAQSRHGLELSVPTAPARLVTFAHSFVASITSRQHGPPPDASPRHVLISLFRI